MKDILINTLYKVGKVWDKYNVFEGAKKKTEAPYTVNEIISKTFCPSPTVTYIFDFTTQEFDYISDSFTSVLGYEEVPKDWTLKDWMEFYPKDYYDDFHEKEVASLSFAQKHFTTEDIYDYKLVYTISFQHKSGHYVPFLHQGFPLATNSFGQITKLLIIHTDMSGFDYFDDKEVSFISMNPDKQSFHSVNNWNYHELSSNEDYVLTNQQLNILRFISEGRSNKEVAEVLDISIETVKTHRRDLLRKSGKSTLYELISDVIDKELL